MKGLNDAKYIAGFVYTTSVLIAITFISTVTLSEYINVYAAIHSFGFWLANSSILGLLFIPKVIILLHGIIVITISESDIKSQLRLSFLDDKVLQRSQWYASTLIQ